MPVGQSMADKARDDAEFASITDATGRELAKQPKVRVRIPGGGPKVPDETVQINGYTFQIKRGEWVTVPQTVAEIMEESGLI